MVSHVEHGDMEETCCSFDLDEEVICYGEEVIFFHEDCSVDYNSCNNKKSNVTNIERLKQNQASISSKQIPWYEKLHDI